MVKKSIAKQIIDEFIEELQNKRVVDGQCLDSLKELLDSGNLKKDDILRVLKEEANHENP